MLDWETKFMQSDPFNEEYVSEVMSEFTDKVQVNFKKIREERLKVQISARKVGRRIERTASLPKPLVKEETTVPSVKLPIPKKKVVVFALEKNRSTTFGSSSNLVGGEFMAQAVQSAAKP